MTPVRRRATAALLLAAVAGVAALAAAPAPAHAGPPPPTTTTTFEQPVGWSTAFTGVEDGAAFTGPTMVLGGTVSYVGPDESPEVDDVQLTLHGEGTPCPDEVLSTSDGDGELSGPSGGGPTTTAVGGAPGGSPSEVTYRFSFSVVPDCNGTYTATVVATAREPVGEEGVIPAGSDLVTDLFVSLTPPPVPGVRAALNPDRTATVTWAAPEGWTAGNAPRDFIGYRIQRADRDGAFANVGSVPPTTLTYRDASLPTAAGIYRYRVFAVRAGAAPGTFTASDPASSTIAQISVAAPGPTSTTARPGRPSPSRGGSPVVAGTVPTVTVDEGFDSTLPFDDDLIFGPEDAVLPEDASDLLEVETDEPGAGIVVPFAIALVITVWALHLRHLSRRASSPA